ncbi:MAG: GNAT family N-acetyltransferase [Saprospiraceae bacterium]|nr:GNAT family N-acetyltransferase [Saprospiraceae bacterium]
MSFEYDFEFFKKLLNSLQRGKLFDLICAVNENEEILAGIIVVYDSETVFYKVGINKKNRNDNGALTFCLWETICHFKEQGLKTFDFEGSDIKTIEHFFRSFGGDLTPVYRVFWSKNLFIRILSYIQNSKIFG